MFIGQFCVRYISGGKPAQIRCSKTVHAAEQAGRDEACAERRGGAKRRGRSGQRWKWGGCTESMCLSHLHPPGTMFFNLISCCLFVLPVCRDGISRSDPPSEVWVEMPLLLVFNYSWASSSHPLLTETSSLSLFHLMPCWCWGIGFTQRRRLCANSDSQLRVNYPQRLPQIPPYVHKSRCVTKRMNEQMYNRPVQ